MSTITNQQFEGKTIEEALSAAVDALGDDLEIVDAQRVRRRGALGLRRKPVFEVVAAKRSLAEPRDFEDVLKRMTDRVDEEERALGSPVDQDRRWWRDADFVVPERPAGATFPNPLEGADIELDVRGDGLVPARALMDEDARRLASWARDGVPAGGSVRLAFTLPESRRDPGAVTLPRADVWVDFDDTRLEANVDLNFQVSTGAPVTGTPEAPLLHISIPPGAVLEVPCPDTATQIEIAEWCLAKGRRIRNPFEHIRVARVLVENTPAAA